MLAAGQAIRFGRQKLLELWQGEPLVRRSARVFLEAGLMPVRVVVGADPRLADALQGLAVHLILNSEPERGISYSIALGVAGLPASVPAVVVGVADQPLLSAAVLRQLKAAFEPGSIVVPRYGAVTGNPRIYDRRFWGELLALTGDRGGQPIAQRHSGAVVEVELAERLGADVDTVEDWRGLAGGP